MRKRLIAHLIVGFICGAVLGNVIALISGSLSVGGFSMVSVLLAKKITYAGAIILQTVLSGAIGIAGVGGMLLYGIDKWSLARATIVHFIAISAMFVISALALDWFPRDFAYYAIALSAMAVAFAVIWLIMYLKWKKEVKKMNEELKEYKDKEI